MKNLLVVAIAGIALAGCEGFGNGSWNPFGSGSSGRGAEERAQQCAKQGLRPGTQRFKLCLEKSAEDAVSSAPVPKNKPIKPATARSEADASESWTDRMMKNINSLFD